MKKVEIEIPEGKKAEWINGVLTLVDDTPKDIKERVKTFEDAMAVLGENHPLVIHYKEIHDNFLYEGGYEVKNIVAYLKLRIICSALNEGWKPIFNEDESRYFPWFKIYSKYEWEKLDEDVKNKFGTPMWFNINANADHGFVFAEAGYSSSYSRSDYVSRLAFKTRDLAEYCGKQFIAIWADFLFA